MNPRITCLVALGLAATAWVSPAAAQNAADNVAGPLVPPGKTLVDVEAEEAEVVDFPTAGARFTFGFGAGYTPDYFGAEDYSFGPAGTLRFDYIKLPGGLEFGGTGAVGFVEGFGPRGSLRYIPERSASDNKELDGLDKVDATLELGLGLGYEAMYWRAFGDMRYGVIGSHAWVGEIGADAILRPRDDLVVNFGPRAEWGSGSFMNTYFGVNEREAERSRFDAYDPSSGLYGVGLELGARYSLSPQWGVEGKAVYSRLVNDAGDSPIVENGTANQFDMQVIITRSLSLGF